MMNSMECPVFSVVIPVFNRVEPLRRTLHSVLQQNLADFEVIVVDDGSDSSIAADIVNLITELQDSRFRLIAYPENRNGAYARNLGIAAARGRYICLLDSDDSWLPEKLSKCLDYLHTHPDCRLFYHRYQNIQANSAGPALPEQAIRAGQSVAEYSFCVNKYGGIQSSCITVETAHAQQIRFNQALRGHQDWDFVIRAAVGLDNIGFVPEVLTHRHIAEGNIGMVSRNLNYQFSRGFLCAYRQYFSLKATAAYAAYILTHKRLKTWPKPAFDHYQLLAWLYHPYHCYRQYRQLRLLKARCDRLVDYCQQHNIRHLALVGYNDYTEFFLGAYGKNFADITLIDKAKRITTVFGSSRRAAELMSDDWQRIELLVAMTDHHFVSMQYDLAPYTDKALQMYAF